MSALLCAVCAVRERAGEGSQELADNAEAVYGVVTKSVTERMEYAERQESHAAVWKVATYQPHGK